MNKSIFTRYFLTLTLLFSLFAVSLPQIGYAQAAAAPAAQTASDLQTRLAGIEEKLEKRRKELGIPGMSLVIVKDDQIIYMKGLGYKDFEKQIAVTPDTQFAIGSATKAFTALSALMSVDEGKLSLDDSPKKYLPYFKINNPDIDAKITVRDLMCHSSGLNRTDLAMITGKLTRQELIQVAGEAKPVAGLREKFMYQNLMFTAAGEIVATVQKEPWEKFIPERIFKPLGMKNSSLSMKQMEKVKDFSYGYQYNFDTKETQRLPFRDIDQVAPAGSINSSARDMAQWLRFVLNGGTVNGKPLVSAQSYQEWTKPQMKIGGTSSYGLGWFLQEWNGLKVVQHGGNIDGFNSLVAMIPEKKLGFVMLTNVSGSSLGGELMPIVWQGILGEKTPEDSGKLPLKTMEKMAGRYRFAEAKMDVEVRIEGDHMTLNVPGQPAYTLERTAPRQFKLGGAPDGFAVKFTPEQGDATEIYLQQPQGNYTLPRIKDDGSVGVTAVPGMAGPNPAKELVGKYEGTTGRSVEIKDEAGKISLVVPGQQPYELKEKTKDLYSAPPLPDEYGLKVTRTADGKLEGIEMVQPTGNVKFKFAGVKEAPKITSDELMAKVVEASGGEANWRKLNSRVSTFEMDLENEGVKGHGIIYAKAPNKTATWTTMTALGKDIADGYEYFDGTGGQEFYSFAPVSTYAGKRLEDVKLGADFYSLLDWKTSFKKVQVIDTAKVGGEECYVVSFEPEKGTKYTEFYSTKSFLLLKHDGVQPSSTSSIEYPFTITFSDYRDVDGVKLPFKTVNSSPSSGNIVTTVKDVKHNVEIKDDVFKLKKM
ncbi:MAG TPA: serine hydrolase [Pyrinomonadaceae bacterium]|jgi:CubicO group peptidase (beta-lactamase class C family)|nr:serine hydrolase [Pyrinomonadaceae bacterium]